MGYGWYRVGNVTPAVTVALQTLSLSTSVVTAGVHNTAGVLVFPNTLTLATSAVSTSAINEGEALLFVIDGQSNAGTTGDGELLDAGWLAIGAEMKLRAEQDTGTTNFVDLPFPFTKDTFGIDESGFGAELGFYATIRAYYPNRKIYFYRKRHGGNSIVEWCSNTVCAGSNYDDTINWVASAKAQADAQTGVTSVKIAGYLWIQNEADTETAQLANNYETRLRELTSSLRSDWSEPNLPVMFIRPHTREASAQFTTVDNAVLAVAADTHHTAAIDTIDLSEYASSPAHFDTDGVLELGIRFGEAYLNIVGLA